jgi:hypothetical protein
VPERVRVVLTDRHLGERQAARQHSDTARLVLLDVGLLAEVQRLPRTVGPGRKRVRARCEAEQ